MTPDQDMIVSEARLREILAAHLCEEYDVEFFPTPGASWPEDENDDGKREGGYIAIQPKHTQARAREIADRILSLLALRPKEAGQAVDWVLEGEPVGGIEMEWRDACATEDCMRPATERLEYGGVGSLYCKDCYDKIMALFASPAVTVGVKPQFPDWAARAITFDVITDHFNGQLTRDQIEGIEATVQRSLDRRFSETAALTSPAGETAQVEDARWQKLRDDFGFTEPTSIDQIMTHIEFIQKERARLLYEVMLALSAKESPEQLQERSGIYVASKVKHAEMWRDLRNFEQMPIISTWIDEAYPEDMAGLWERCIREASTAAAFLIYRRPDEVLKGAWTELGAALASGVPVFAVGIEEFTIAKDRRIQHFPDLVAARAAIRALPLSTGGGQ